MMRSELPKDPSGYGALAWNAKIALLDFTKTV